MIVYSATYSEIKGFFLTPRGQRNYKLVVLWETLANVRERKQPA